MTELNILHSSLDREFIREETLCQQLGISIRCMQRLHEARRGPPKIKIGNQCILYRIESLIAWLNSQESRIAANQSRSNRT